MFAFFASSSSSSSRHSFVLHQTVVRAQGGPAAAVAMENAAGKINSVTPTPYDRIDCYVIFLLTNRSPNRCIDHRSKFSPLTQWIHPIDASFFKSHSNRALSAHASSHTIVVKSAFQSQLTQSAPKSRADRKQNNINNNRQSVLCEHQMAIQWSFSVSSVSF